jgi:steroid 5-alpha reductase family enzyme
MPTHRHFHNDELAMNFPWTTIGLSAAAAAGAVVIVAAVTFGVATRVGRHSVIDTAWGLGFLAALVAAEATALATTDHPGTGRRVLITALTAVWAIRLALHTGLRSRGADEDPRYAEMLRRAAGDGTPGTREALRVIYLPQTIAIWFVSWPLLVTVVGGGDIGPLGWLGLAVWVVGFWFEAGGDWQLTRFGADPANRGSVLDYGLWRYTRHPNYFGDAAQWWGFSLIAFAHWPGIVTIASPALMTWFLARKTGKPLLESRLTKTRPGYADYVARTSGFFPWPPRS